MSKSTVSMQLGRYGTAGGKLPVLSITSTPWDFVKKASHILSESRFHWNLRKLSVVGLGLVTVLIKEDRKSEDCRGVKQRSSILETGNPSIDIAMMSPGIKFKDFTLTLVYKILINISKC